MDTNPMLPYTMQELLPMVKEVKHYIPGPKINQNRLPIVESIPGAVDLLRPMYEDLMTIQEKFGVLLLNRNNRVIGFREIGRGGVGGVTVDPRLIFKAAIDLLASGIIICHNHPSGNLKPSASDIALTKQIEQGGKLLEVKLLDHIILTQDGYRSLRDDGTIGG